MYLEGVNPAIAGVNNTAVNYNKPKGKVDELANRFFAGLSSIIVPQGLPSCSLVGGDGNTSHPGGRGGGK